MKVVVKISFRKKLVKSKLPCAGHAERRGDEKLLKREDAQKMEGKRRRGRPKLRWGIALRVIESAGGIVVTTSACHAGATGSIPGTGSCDIKNLALNIGDCVSLVNRRITLMSVPSQFGT